MKNKFFYFILLIIILIPFRSSAQSGYDYSKYKEIIQQQLHGQRKIPPINLVSLNAGAQNLQATAANSELSLIHFFVFSQTQKSTSTFDSSFLKSIQWLDKEFGVIKAGMPVKSIVVGLYNKEDHSSELQQIKSAINQFSNIDYFLLDEVDKKDKKRSGVYYSGKTKDIFPLGDPGSPGGDSYGYGAKSFIVDKSGKIVYDIIYSSSPIKKYYPFSEARDFVKLFFAIKNNETPKGYEKWNTNQIANLKRGLLKMPDIFAEHTLTMLGGGSYELSKLLEPYDIITYSLSIGAYSNSSYHTIIYNNYKNYYKKQNSSSSWEKPKYDVEILDSASMYVMLDDIQSNSSILMPFIKKNYPAIINGNTKDPLKEINSLIIGKTGEVYAVINYFLSPVQILQFKMLLAKEI